MTICIEHGPAPFTGALAAMLIGISLAGSAMAEETPKPVKTGLMPAEIGAATSIDKQVTAIEGPKPGIVVTGDVIFQDETIQTGQGATAEFRFADDTVFAMAENSRIVLDEFVYDAGASGIDKLAVTALVGSFRFISGKVPKDNIAINTPHGSIGVRGTAFDVYVAEDGEAQVGLLEGEVRVCNNRRADCRELVEKGRFLRLTAKGLLDVPDDWRVSMLRGVPFERAFPFITNQAHVSAVFRTADATIGKFADFVEKGGVKTGRIIRKAGEKVIRKSRDVGTKIVKGAVKTGKKAGKIVRKTGSKITKTIRKPLLKKPRNPLRKLFRK